VVVSRSRNGRCVGAAPVPSADAAAGGCAVDVQRAVRVAFAVCVQLARTAGGGQVRGECATGTLCRRRSFRQWKRWWR